MTGVPHGLGHNQGPTMEPGGSWRTLCWRKARAELLPKTLPIEIIRGRVRRAKELGLDYSSYASIRAASGHDVVAILFSSNALRTFPGTSAPKDRVEKLSRLTACKRTGLAVAPLSALALIKAVDQLDDAYPAPRPFAAWARQKAELRLACGATPGDQVLLVGDSAAEREWLQSGRFAGYLSADRYFVDQTGV